MSKFVAYALALGGALLLLCTCAEREHPQATGASPSATTTIPTGIPTDASSPSLLPSIEPTSKPLTYTLTAAEQDPSDADLAIQVPEPVQIVPGETAIYTLTIRNHGPDPATGIVLTDMLPDGVTPLWTQPVQPAYERLEGSAGCDLGNLQGGDTATVALDLSAGEIETVITGTHRTATSVDLLVPTCAISQDAARPQVTCRLARLHPGAETQVQIGVEVDTPLAGTLNHTVTVEANESDATPSNNGAVFTMMVESLGGTPAAGGLVAVPAVSTSSDLVVQADGPSSIITGQPFTYTYTITNQGALLASDVRFEDALPSDLTLMTYAPAPPLCKQRGDSFTCSLRDLDSGETVTFTLVITGHAGQPMRIDLDPLLPGWPMCYVVKERTWLHIVNCELGNLQPGQTTRVQLVLSAVGVQERMTANTASVSASEADLNPVDNTITTTMTVKAQADP